jgi:hypothetical protein
MRRLTFAPNGDRYKTGFQAFNSGPERITVTAKVYRNGKEGQDGYFVDEFKFTLGVRSEALFKLADHFALSEDFNYSIDFSATSESGLTIYAYHVDPQGGLFFAPTQEVPTQPEN